MPDAAHVGAPHPRFERTAASFGRPTRADGRGAESTSSVTCLQLADGDQLSGNREIVRDIHDIFGKKLLAV